MRRERASSFRISSGCRARKHQLGGALTFDLHASGTTAAPQVNGKLALENLTLNGQSAGDVNANVQTTGHTLSLNAMRRSPRRSSRWPGRCN